MIATCGAVLSIVYDPATLWSPATASVIVPSPEPVATVTVRVVPVPVHPDYFAVPAWRPGQRVVLDVPCYVTPPPDGELSWPPRPVGLAATAEAERRGVRGLYKKWIKPRLPGRLARFLQRTSAAVRAARWAFKSEVIEGDPVPLRPEPSLDLSGVVYTTVLNPYDYRKNWPDLLTGFFLALKDQPDATLVVRPEPAYDVRTRVSAAGGAWREKQILRHVAKVRP